MTERTERVDAMPQSQHLLAIKLGVQPIYVAPRLSVSFLRQTITKALEPVGSSREASLSQTALKEFNSLS